ncbi:mammalian cell entry protein [Mycobacterium kansasii]|uniref:mammalian cell entry protein n=1 Tax=Mycobacterium kansasii TaxID=1768 RepID=UPI000CDCE890|nr:mammalian cell entry protein [Mycobacterium kansasii]POY06375.1 mammalian cell entry protein [Mycobacterium kansasii]
MRLIVSGIAGLVAAAFVSLAALGGGLYWQRVETRGEQAARSELGPLAVFTYDYKTVERNLIDAYDLLTPGYRKEFEDRAKSDIIPQARARELVSQANVVGVGVMEAQRDSAAVMVYINRTVSEKTNRDEPIYDGARLRVDYRRIDGKWLIDYITPI